MTERAKFKGVINLIIKDDDKILLFFRNDGFFNYGGGWWVMPAGHIEQGETAMAAAIREAKEELDINILPEDIEFSHIISNQESKTEGFYFFFTVKKFTGTIRNCEGDKCVEMRYMTMDEINNTKNVISITRQVLNAIANEQTYSELKEYRTKAFA